MKPIEVGFDGSFDITSGGIRSLKVRLTRTQGWNDDFGEQLMENGTVVVFEPKNFNPEFWNNLPEKDRIKYYGPLGYGSDKKKFFVFLTEIKNAPGHCVLVDLDDGHIEVMRHVSDFREVNKEEF